MTEYELRFQAAERGEKRYAGKTCDLHPGAQRYTSNGACVDCTNDRRQTKHDVIRELLKKNSAV